MGHVMLWIGNENMGDVELRGDISFIVGPLKGI
jgi:hypothetical protein